jgi:hypothetical protein
MFSLFSFVICAYLKLQFVVLKQQLYITIEICELKVIYKLCLRNIKQCFEHTVFTSGELFSFQTLNIFMLKLLFWIFHYLF